MNLSQRPGATPRARTRRSVSPDAGSVFALDRARIERALAGRSRYKYVHPQVLREGSGWKIVSANCSRNIDAAGGEIDIAWFEPDGVGRWRLHARDHAAHGWIPKAQGLTLVEALTRVCADPLREYWP